MQPMIRFENVSKIFCNDIDLSRSYAIGDMFRPGGRRSRNLRRGEFFALRDISFCVGARDVLLVLGTPDSGLSTIAGLIGGFIRPDEGRVEVGGTPRIITGGKLGFNALMTLRENLQLATALFGASPEEQCRSCDEIMDFCEVRRLADVKMHDIHRDLAKAISFSIPLFVKADVYVFDNVLAVSNKEFRKKCREKVDEVIQEHAAVLLARNVKELPGRVDLALILHEGAVVWKGSPEAAGPIYQELVKELEVSPIHDTPEEFKRRFAKIVELHAGRVAPSLPAASTEERQPRERPIHLRANKLFKLLRPQMSSPMTPDRVSEEISRRVSEEISRIGRNGKPVLVGPWFSNVGLELLYWIPFLNWAVNHCGLVSDHLVAISRSGAGLWYKNSCGNYVDIYDVTSPEDFMEKERERVQQLGHQKQNKISAFETEVLEMAAASLRMKDFEVLHPALLYKFFALVWRGVLPVSVVHQHTLFQEFPRVHESESDSALPEEYVAVKFNFSACFPDREDNRTFVSDLLKALAHHIDVVVLNTGIYVDGDADCPVLEGERIHNLRHVAVPRNNLEIQTKAISKARAFVGTLGGISYLAPIYKVPSITFYADEAGYMSTHLNVARYACSAVNGKSMSVYNIADLNPDRILFELGEKL